MKRGKTFTANRVFLFLIGYTLTIRYPIFNFAEFNIRPLELVILIGLPFSFAKMALLPKSAVFERRPLALFFILILSMLPSTIATLSPIATFSFIAKVSIGIVLAMIILNLTSSVEDLMALEFGLILWTFPSLIIHIISYWTPSLSSHLYNITYANGISRLNGWFEDPNYFGAWVAVMLIYIWIRAVFKKSLLNFLLMILLSTALILTFSRTSWFAMVMGSMAMLSVFLIRCQRAFYPALRYVIKTLSVLSLCIFLLPVRTNLIADIVSRAHTMIATNVRYALWKDAVHIMLTYNNWLTGIGVGAFPMAHKMMAFNNVRYYQEWFFDLTLHNTYLDALVSGGILHFAALVVLLLYVFKSSFRLTNHRFRNSLPKWFVFGSLGMLLVLYVSMLTLNMLDVRYTWFIIGFALVVDKLARKKSKEEQG